MAEQSAAENGERNMTSPVPDGDGDGYSENQSQESSNPDEQMNLEGDDHVSADPGEEPCGSGRSPCPECRKPNTLVICDHCDSFTCEPCRDLHFNDVREKIKELHVETRALMSRASSKRDKCYSSLGTVHHKVMAALSEIEKTSHMVIKTVQMRCTQLKEEVVRESQAYNDSTLTFQGNLTESMIALNELSSGNPNQITVNAENIKAKQELCEKWTDEVIQMENTIASPPNYNLEFTADTEFVYDVISTFGTLQISKNIPSTADSSSMININYHSIGEPKMILGSEDSGSGQFSDPTYVAVSPLSGKLVVTDRDNNRVKILSDKGYFLSELGSDRSTEKFQFGRWVDAGGVAVTTKGTIIVADTDNDRVLLFNETGHFIRSIGGQGTDPGKFNSPRGLATDKTGQIYISDCGNSRIQVLGQDGTVIRVFGTKDVMGAWTPSGIATCPNEEVVVTDRRGMLQVFTSNGQHKATIDNQQEGFPALKCPCGVAVDNLGNMIITDYLGQMGHVLDQGGKWICSFGGSQETTSEQRGLVGVAVTTKGQIVVVDQVAHKLKMY